MGEENERGSAKKYNNNNDDFFTLSKGESWDKLKQELGRVKRRKNKEEYSREGKRRGRERKRKNKKPLQISVFE